MVTEAALRHRKSDSRLHGLYCVCDVVVGCWLEPWWDSYCTCLSLTASRTEHLIMSFWRQAPAGCRNTSPIWVKGVVYIRHDHIVAFWWYL